MPTGQVKQRRKKYLEWLRGHPELWYSRPEVVVRQMKAESIISASTYWGDIRCIPELQRQLRLEQDSGK